MQERNNKIIQNEKCQMKWGHMNIVFAEKLIAQHIMRQKNATKT